MTKTLAVPETAFEEWLQNLEQTYSVRGDNVHKVKTAMRAFMEENKKEEPSDVGLAFKDVRVGTTYQFTSASSTPSHLQGIKVRIAKKNRTRVIVEFLQDTDRFHTGERASVKPHMLTHV